MLLLHSQGRDLATPEFGIRARSRDHHQPEHAVVAELRIPRNAHRPLKGVRAPGLATKRKLTHIVAIGIKDLSRVRNRFDSRDIAIHECRSLAFGSDPNSEPGT